VRFGKRKLCLASIHILSIGISTFLLAASCFAADAALPTVAASDNRTPAGHRNANGLTLRLEVRQGHWSPENADGRSYDVYSFAEEGRTPETPGPMIRVPESTHVHVSVHNTLAVTVFVHGLQQHPIKADDAIEIAAGQMKEADFSAGEAGTYLYWASSAKGDIENRPLEEGLMSGAFIVDAANGSIADRVFVIQVRAKDLFHPTFEGVLSINGKSWPNTERLQAQIGQPEHWRVINATPLLHPMHLHGFYYRIDAVGDWQTAHRYDDAEKRMVVTELLTPGHTFDMTWVPERTGNWLFHCHLFDHMSNYKTPWVYGPDGPPTAIAHAHEHADGTVMGMGDLVMGITVSGSPHLVEAKMEAPHVTTHRDLFVRQRKATPYVPAGPGFYLEGVSQSVGAVGPPLVVTRGETTAITVHNELDEPTAVHWHGIEIESYYDGVPGWTGAPQHTTPYIGPGQSFVAYMTPPRAGTFIYHTHWHNVDQLIGGLYGALLVMEPGQTYSPELDKVFVLGRGGRNEMKDPLLVNGSSQPELMVLLTGKTYRFRFVNITPEDAIITTSLSLDSHPVSWRAIAKDGADLPPQQATARDAMQVVSVGETYDFAFSPEKPGAYQLRFCSKIGSEITQPITIVPPGSPYSVFAKK
jgi:FtsP/CotA-like multicopper oxidase with cupredoxin domain